MIEYPYLTAQPGEEDWRSWETVNQARAHAQTESNEYECTVEIYSDRGEDKPAVKIETWRNGVIA